MTDSHIVTVRGESWYRIETDGVLDHSNAMGATVEGNDTISADGKTKSGAVGGGTDSTLVLGIVTDFALGDTANATVYLDGEEVPPGELAERTQDSSETDRVQRRLLPAPIDGLAGIQEVIDEVADSGGGLVSLLSDKYRIDGPIDIKRDVALDCRYATVEQTVDENVFQCWPGSRLKNFNVDIDAPSWTSSVLALNTAFDESKYGAQNDRVVVDGGGGHVQGISSGGDDGYAIRLRSDQYQDWIAFNQIGNFSVRDFDTVAHFKTQDSDGSKSFINDNLIDITAIDFRDGIRMESTSITGDPILSNQIRGQWQETGPTELLWYCNVSVCNANFFLGSAWDWGGSDMWIVQRGHNNTLLNFARNGDIEFRGGSGNSAHEIADVFDE